MRQTPEKQPNDEESTESGGTRKAKIFIVYRRDESAVLAGRLYDRLASHFGREAVFMDIHSIPYGVDFRKHITDEINQCDVLLAVIGEHWLDASYEGGPKQGSRGYDLQVIFPVKDVSAIPTTGKRLVIVATVGHVLHFRIFDNDGKMVVDTDATQRPAQAAQISDLRKQLETLWPPHELTTSDKSRVIDTVTSIVGHTRLRRLNDPRDYVRIEIEAALARDIPVVPLLVDRATMPREADLPEGLKALTYRQAAVIRTEPDFDVQVDRLIHSLERLVGQNETETALKRPSGALGGA